MDAERVVTIGVASLFLAGESDFMENTMGIDPEVLDSRWAEHMLMVKYPLTEAQASWLLQQVGWF